MAAFLVAEQGPAHSPHPWVYTILQTSLRTREDAVEHLSLIWISKCDA